MRPVLIALATAWGPRFGGINAFNTELLKSLGVYQGRGFEVACVLPRVSAEEAHDAQHSCSLTLLGLNRPDDEFDPATLNHDLEHILAERGWQHPIWLGHDDKTGPLPSNRNVERWMVEHPHAWNEHSHRLIMHHDRLSQVAKTWGELTGARFLLCRLMTTQFL